MTTEKANEVIVNQLSVQQQELPLMLLPPALEIAKCGTAPLPYNLLVNLDLAHLQLIPTPKNC